VSTIIINHFQWETSAGIDCLLYLVATE